MMRQEYTENVERYLLTTDEVRKALMEWANGRRCSNTSLTAIVTNEAEIDYQDGGIVLTMRYPSGVKR